MHPANDSILWDIEERHLHEAEFLFGVWEALLDAPHYTLSDVLVGPEERLIAHVDALTLGGPVVGQRLLWDAIEDEHTGYEMCASATLALVAEAERAACERLLGILDHAADEQRRGIIRGLQLSERRDIDHWLLAGLHDATVSSTSARLEILAGRQYTPGPWLKPFLASADARTLRAAVTLARCAPTIEVPLDWDRLAHAEDPALCRSTITAALVRGVPGAWESAVYWAFCRGDSPFRRDALTWVALLGNAVAHERLLALLDHVDFRADALWALGFAGRRAAVDQCIELLDDGEVGHLAGEVVSAIAGLPTDDDRYWRARPKSDEPDDGLPELERDELDADLVPVAEDDLPCPHPQEIVAWWRTRRDTMDPRLRHQGGEPLRSETLVDALREGPMRRRHAIALELSIRSQGAVAINSRGLCRVQRAQLDALRGSCIGDCQRGLALR